MTRLFSGSWLDLQRQFTQQAIADVEAMDRAAFNRPNLAGQLEKIASKYKIDVAELDRSGVQANGRTEKRERSDYGNRVMVDVSLLDVNIPFRGAPESLNLAPSTSHVIDEDARVGNGVITITVRDDSNADREVETFISRVAENLDRLRKEVEQYQPHILEAVKHAAERRGAAVAAENDRDKGRSFPVRRG